MKFHSRAKFELGLGAQKISTPEIIALDNAYPSPSYLLGNSTRFSAIAHIELQFQVDEFTQAFFRAQASKIVQFSSGAFTGGTLSGSSMPYRLSAGIRGRWLRPWGMLIEGSLDHDSYQYIAQSRAIYVSYKNLEVLTGIFYLF